MGGYDAYVLKFDPNGVSLWGTYYGGSTGLEYTTAIALNSAGDVYFVGETSSSDFPVVPSGSTSLNTIGDGFIVRLNNSGTTAKWARYFGGSSSTDEIRDVAVDGDDNVYVVGMTESYGSFPIKPKTGAYNQNANSGLGDGFIAKYDNDNNQLWGSFFGGSGPDNFSAIVVGANNDVFISGSTNSTTAASSDPGNTPCDVPNSSLYFPDCDASGAAYIQSWGGGTSVNHDAIIVQFDSAGVLRWSTYFGGRGNESSQIILTNSIAIHPSDPNTLYLVCWTDESTNMFITGGGSSYVQNAPIFATNHMTYIAKFNFRFPSWGSLFGCGEGNITRGQDVTVDNSGNVYVVGITYSTDYPTTSGAYNESFNGGDDDVFVTKLNALGSDLVYSTFLGGSGNEYGWGIVLDNANNIYVTGTTSSSDFPTTSNVFDESYNDNWDVFVTKLNALGSALVYSTFIGASDFDYGHVIALDNFQNVYVTGWTYSTDYPTTIGAYDESYNGGSDVFVTKLNAKGSALVYSSFIGGSGRDKVFGIALDNTRNVYVTGETQSSDYPTTSGAYDESFNGYEDVFVSKLNAAGSALVYSTIIGGCSNDEGLSIAIDNVGSVYVTGFTRSIEDRKSVV